MTNINNWLQNNTYHHSQFSDIKELIQLKKKKAQRDSVTEVFSKVGKSGQNTLDKIILWFKT